MLGKPIIQEWSDIKIAKVVTLNLDHLEYLDPLAEVTPFYKKQIVRGRIVPL